MKLLTRSPAAARQKASLPHAQQAAARPNPLVLKRPAVQQSSAVKAQAQQTPVTGKQRVALKAVTKVLLRSTTSTASALTTARRPVQVQNLGHQTVPDASGYGSARAHSEHLTKVNEQLSLLSAKVDALTDLIRRMSADGASGRKAPASKTGPTDPEQGLSAKEAAALLGIGRATFYELLKRDDFVCPIKVGKRSVRYSRADLLAWRLKQTAG